MRGKPVRMPYSTHEKFGTSGILSVAVRAGDQLARQRLIERPVFDIDHDMNDQRLPRLRWRKPFAVGRHLIGNARVRHDCLRLRWRPRQLRTRREMSSRISPSTVRTYSLNCGVVGSRGLREVDLDSAPDAPRTRRHDDDPIRQIDRFVDAVGDEHDRRAMQLPNAKQLGLHDAPRLRIERAERLVHQQYLWLCRQRAGNANTLAHAAGQLVREFLFEAAKTYDFDKLIRDFHALRRGNAARLQIEGDVGARAHPGKQAVLLKDHAGVAMRAGEWFAIDRHGSIGRRLPGRRGSATASTSRSRKRRADRRIHRIRLSG